jgi:hypothetical protein
LRHGDHFAQGLFGLVAARGRAIEVFQRLNGLEAARVGAEELTAEEVRHPDAAVAEVCSLTSRGRRIPLDQRSLPIENPVTRW